MDKTLAILIQTSVLIISAIYCFRTENKVLKSAIALFGLFVLGLLIRKFTGKPLIGIISYVVIYLSSLIIFMVHIIKTKNINMVNKRMISLVLLTVLLSFVSKVLHLPGYGFLRIFSILPICIVVYLNIKKLDELREELRMVDLISITMIIDLLVFVERYWI